MNISIRPFADDDLEALAAWTANGLLTPYMSRWIPRTAHGSVCARDLCRWHVITVDNRSVGTVWVERAHSDARVADLGLLIGDPKDRGHGIGTAAIRIAEQDAVDLWAIEKVCLRVRADNIGAIGCYQRSGFVAVDRTTVVIDAVGIGVIHMEHDMTLPISTR